MACVLYPDCSGNQTALEKHRTNQRGRRLRRWRVLHRHGVLTFLKPVVIRAVFRGFVFFCKHTEVDAVFSSKFCCAEVRDMRIAAEKAVCVFMYVCVSVDRLYLSPRPDPLISGEEQDIHRPLSNATGRH